MSSLDARTVPPDARSQEHLAAGGLDYRRIDGSDPAEVDGALQAIARGFLKEEQSPEALAAGREELAARRTLGVFDPAQPLSGWPVGTVSGLVLPLTVPGGELDMWAISDVAVASTHRRRGIARAMLEGELRAAKEAGLAVAGLTVSEATIYGRFGFAPAVPVMRWEIQTRRAGWTGPAPAGRLEHVDRELLTTTLEEIHERTRSVRAGQVPGWEQRWRELAGTHPGEKDGAAVRGVRYRDTDGEVRGVMAYRITENPREWTASELSVRYLGAETPEAEAALWRFALQHDLVGTVVAELRPVDEPLPWWLADARAAVGRVRDHEWLRLLDVPRALAARSWSAAVDLTLAVRDPLGLAEGTWRLRAGEGGRAEILPAAEPQLELDVAALAAAYLGGVPLRTLHAAGRVRGETGAVSALEAALRPDQAPQLGIWY